MFGLLSGDVAIRCAWFAATANADGEHVKRDGKSWDKKWEHDCYSRAPVTIDFTVTREPAKIDEGANLQK